MDALSLLHAASLLAWGAAVAVLALILLAARAGGDVARRAVEEADAIGRRALRLASPVALLSAVPAVSAAGTGPAAWAAAFALAMASLAARPAILRPALARAAASAAALRRALRLAALDAAAHGAAIGLLLLDPGTAELLILAGLATCLALAAALILPGRVTALPG